MRTWFPHYLLPLIALAFAVPGCGDPVAPDALAVPQAANDSRLDSNPLALLTPAKVVTTFQLLNGSVTLSLRAADGSAGTVKGTYTGRAVASAPGNTTAALELQIAETSGAGSAVTGLQAEGTGAFVDEGDFTLSLRLASSTSKSVDGLKATLRGTSRLSCSASNRILVIQDATQSTPKFLEVKIDLQHEVGSTQCFN
jgi:hypothetical protein